ncbi:MAG: MBG domain-containing protein, partial [Candidatus Shapirobacteria bacterium]|nr:MBG domain-containing protein [Candidatus Shapirobacteria bacterium]
VTLDLPVGVNLKDYLITGTKINDDNSETSLGTLTLADNQTTFWLSDFSNINGNRQSLVNFSNRTYKCRFTLTPKSDLVGKTIGVSAKIISAESTNFDNPTNWFTSSNTINSLINIAGFTISLDKTKYITAPNQVTTIQSTIENGDFSNLDSKYKIDTKVTLTPPQGVNLKGLHVDATCLNSQQEEISIGDVTLTDNQTVVWLSDFTKVDRPSLQNYANKNYSCEFTFNPPSSLSNKTINLSTQAVGAEEGNFDNPDNWYMASNTVTSSVNIIGITSIIASLESTISPNSQAIFTNFINFNDYSELDLKYKSDIKINLNTDTNLAGLQVDGYIIENNIEIPIGNITLGQNQTSLWLINDLMQQVRPSLVNHSNENINYLFKINPTSLAGKTLNITNQVVIAEDDNKFNNSTDWFTSSNESSIDIKVINPTINFQESSYSIVTGQQVNLDGNVTFGDLTGLDTKYEVDTQVTLDLPVGVNLKDYLITGTKINDDNSETSLGTLTLADNQTTFWLSDFSNINGNRQSLVNFSNRTYKCRFILTPKTELAGKSINVFAKLVGAESDNFDNQNNWYLSSDATTTNISMIENMSGSIVITGDTKFDTTLIINSTLNNSGTPTYQWKRNGVNINGATEPTYTLGLADIGTIITVTATAEVGVGTGSITSTATGVITKADEPAIPSAPILVSKTATSVTLTANVLNQFSKDGINWQDSEIFTELNPNHQYTFFTRIKATETTNESLVSVGVNITTNKLNQNIFFNTLENKTYGDADFNVSATATASSGLLVSFTASGDCNISSNMIHINNAGNCTITAHQTGNSTYNAAQDISQSFSINKKNLVISAQNSTKNYGDIDPIFTASYSGFINNDNDTSLDTQVNLVRATGENVNTYIITASNATSTNYFISFEPGIFTINTKPITVTADAQTKERGTFDSALTYTNSPLVIGDTLSGSLTRVIGEEIGTYLITQGSLNAGTNYAINFVENNLIISDTIAPEISYYTVSDTNIDIFYSEKVSADINILDDHGIKIRDLGSTGIADYLSIFWDGKNNSNQIVTDGIYTIQVIGTDSAGNTFTDTSKTITIDHVGPVITLNGVTENIEVGTFYTEFGATAIDAVEGLITTTPSGSVNTTVVGTYTITYTATDMTGNTTTATRIVNVVDTTKPVITRIGLDTVNLEIHTLYTDAGVTASDNYDNNLTSSIIIDTTNINKDIVGTYTVNYNVADTHGNQAIQITRIVNVVDSVDTAFNVISDSLSTNGIDNNLNNINTDNIQHFSGLYFKKIIDGVEMGKITFNSLLDLTSSETRIFLQDLENYLDMSLGHIALDARTVTTLKNAGASIEMYNLPQGLNINQITLTIKDENNIVLDNSIVSDMNYEDLGICEVGEICTKFSFNTQHFTIFDVNIDNTPPTVTKLGNDSADVILPNGNTNLVFNEELSVNSKTTVENALTSGADNTLTYSWTGATLIINNPHNSAITFNNDVIVNVIDLAGNNTTLLLIDSKLDATQITPNESGLVTVDSTTPELVITNPEQDVIMTVTSGTVDPKIDVSAFITNGEGVLPKITINSDNADIVIPNNTIVTSADTSWDGIIAAPIITTVSLPETSGETKTLGTAIEIGFVGAKLSFDKAVRILLPNQAGKKAGYIRTGIDFTEITNTCSVDNQTTGDSLIAGGDCKIDVGSDMVIWTKHFTKFASYTQTINSSSNSNNENEETTTASAPVCNDQKPGSAPTLLSAVAGINSVTLFWSKAADPVSYYLVTYGKEPGLQQYGNPNIGDANTTSYTIEGLSGDTTYYFKIRAGNGCMPGDFSNELSAHPSGQVITTSATGFETNVLGENIDSSTKPIESESTDSILGSEKSDQKGFNWYYLFLILFIIPAYIGGRNLIKK